MCHKMCIRDRNKNIYQTTREALRLTRETASELLETIPPERIEKIENERSLPHPDEVLTMAEKYKQPDLCLSLIHILKNAATKLAGAIVKPGLREFKKMLDYNEVGGAPLLGISKPIVKAHGSSGAEALKNAVRQAVVYAEGGVVADIERSVAQLSAGGES